MYKYIELISNAPTKANVYIILSNAAGDLCISSKQWQKLLVLAEARLEIISCLR